MIIPYSEWFYIPLEIQMWYYLTNTKGDGFNEFWRLLTVYIKKN